MLALIISTSVIWSLTRVGLWQAPERDEGHYVVLGWRVAAGERLYVDFYDGAQKPPLMYWTPAAAVKLLGRRALVFPCLRVITIFAKIASALLIFSVGKMLATRRVGWLAAAFFSFHALVARVGNQVMSEPYSTLFALLGLWVFLKSQQSLAEADATGSPGTSRSRPWAWWGYFACGFLIAVGILYRPTPLFLAVPMGIVILAGKSRWRHKLRVLGTVIAGGLAGLMPLILYLAFNHAFENFYVMVVRFMLAYPAEPYSLRSRLQDLQLSFFSPAAFRWLIPLALLTGLVQALKQKSSAWLMMAGWFALQMVMVFKLRRVEWHYHYEFLPAFVLLFALGFERLLVSAKALYANAETGSRAHWLLAEGNLIRLIATILLPLAILVVFHNLQWAAMEWKAGMNPGGELAKAIWPAVTALLAGGLLVIWKAPRKYHLFLVALCISAVVLLLSPRGGKMWQLASGPGISLCFTFALVGWLWQVARVIQHRASGLSEGPLSRLAARALAPARNFLTVVLWLSLVWILLAQAHILVKKGPLKTKLRDAERAAQYVQDNLAAGNEVLSTTGELIFLMGERLPTYWGEDHEKVAAEIGIAEMVGRELADVPAYCAKHRVQFVVFARGETLSRMGQQGEDYISQYFESARWIGPYLIYQRKSSNNA